MQQDLVNERRWVDRDEFARVLPLIKSMPGPVAFQAVLYLARARVGTWAAVVSGVLFVLPAFVLMVAFAMSSRLLREQQQIHAFFLGAQSVALALIFWALRDLTRSFLLNRRFWAYGIVSGVLLVLLDVPEPLVIVGTGCLAILGRRLSTLRLRSVSMELFFLCFKAGALAFGTGLAIVPLLQGDFERWVSHEEFLQAVSLGQLTPGPVVIAVTYLGFQVSGWTGAIAATVGIFLPATINMLTWFPRAFRKLAAASWFSDFMVGGMAALSVGILSSLVSLSTELTPTQFLILCAAVIGGLFIRLPAYVWVLLGGLVHLSVGWI